MKFTTSLRQNHLFRRLYARGRSQAAPCLVLYARRNGREGNRLGLTVSAKLGGAVVRNRVRRRLREIYRAHEAQFLPGWDLVAVARSRAVYAPYGELERAFLKTARGLGLLRREGEGR